MSQSNKNSCKSVFKNVYRQPYGTYSSRIKLYSATKGSRDFVQRLGLLKKLPIHNGCVNCISWSDDGRLLLSGSDDQHLIVSNAYNHKILTDYKTSHRANIFCAKFLPCTNDTHIVSCAGDGMILFSDVTRLNETHQNIFNCHSGTTYKLVTIPNDPYSFLSCGEDFTVRCFDLRTKQKCSKHQCTEDVLINCGRAVTALAVNPWAPYQFAVGSADSTVRLYDGRMLSNKPEVENTCSPNYLCSFTVPALSHGAYRITSLAFSPEGEELLASYSAEYLYLFNIKNYDKCELHSNSARVSPQTRRANSHNAATQSNFPAVRRLRLRGDWSDTGPDARPEQEFNSSSESSPARRSLHAIFMRRMTNAIFRIFNTTGNRGGAEEGNQDVNVTEEQEDAEQMRNENEGEAGESSSAVNETTLNISVSESQSSNTDSSNSNPSSCQRNETQASSSSPSTSRTGAANVQLPSFEQTYSSLVKQPKSAQSASISQHPPSPNNCPSESHSMDTEDTVSPSMSSSSAANVIAASEPSTSFNTKSPRLAAMCEPSRVPSATNSQGRASVATQTEFQLNSATTAVTESSFTLASFLSNVPQILSTTNYLRQTDDALSSIIQNDDRHNSQNASPISPAPNISVSQSSLSNVASEGSTVSHSQEATNVSLENCDSTSNISNESSCKSDNLNDPTKLISNSASDSTCQNVPASKLLPCSSSEAEQNSAGKSDTHENSVESVQCDTGANENCNESLNFNSVKAQIDAISCQVADKSVGLTSENEDINDPSSSSSCSSSCSDSRIDSAARSREVQSFIKKSKFASTKLQNNSFDVSKTCSENLAQGISTSLGNLNEPSARNDQATALISSASCINKSSNTPEQFSDQLVLPSHSLSSKPQNPVDSVSLTGNEDDSNRDDDLAELLDSHSPNVNNSKQTSAKSPIHSSCESICESNTFDDYEHENVVEENEYPFITQKYTGHRNARTMIKEATFWGNDHVLSGSDCGHVFIWDRWTAKLTMLLQADNHVVNCIQPHPFQPILATSGIDYDVKLWAPINEESAFDEEKAQELMQRNIVMLEETKDTITVPASFALRMLAFLSQMRRGRRSFPNEPDQ